ncbi:calcineurin subunit B type 1-like protein [Anopheles sinensis]|uniref:Calcineurin subunit B type 1-like protein n=1 Tax=Anopheles sinensis TaxID=74873 RepID=A0A084WS04_ANOSI|nr:calcineurin subunit B type 1-like protein [Anopheles sinensis]
MSPMAADGAELGHGHPLEGGRKCRAPAGRYLKSKLDLENKRPPSFRSFLSAPFLRGEPTAKEMIWVLTRRNRRNDVYGAISLRDFNEIVTLGKIRRRPGNESDRRRSMGPIYDTEDHGSSNQYVRPGLHEAVT